MLYHFAVTDIQYLVCVPGVTVVLTTDTPCHLYMRWTNQLPLIHLDPFIRRGVAVGARPRYCFDLYTDNEQFETGDSITHTFIKPGWSCCETRYFYFWGCKFGYLMPSESCIFEYHNPFNDPQDIECPFIKTGLFVQGTSTSWHTAKIIYPGYGICPMNPYAQALYTGVDYYCGRCSMTFDTSLIPPGSHICEANIRLYDNTVKWWLVGHGDYSVYLVDGNQWNEDCDYAWYSQWHYWNDVCAKYYIPINKSPSCELYPLTPLGLTHIVPAGHTKYVIRLHYDYEEIPPVDMTDEYSVNPVAAGCHAQLQVNYCSPC